MKGFHQNENDSRNSLEGSCQNILNVAPAESNRQLKSLSPLFFSVFDEKLSHLWIQIQKKQLDFLRLSMSFDRKKIKI